MTGSTVTSQQRCGVIGMGMIGAGVVAWPCWEGPRSKWLRHTAGSGYPGRRQKSHPIRMSSSSPWSTPTKPAKCCLDLSEVKNAFAEALHDLVYLNVLANIAGIERLSPAESITEQELDLIFKINFYGTVYTNQAAFQHMREHGGRIINFGSATGLMPYVNGAHYSASKGAIISWTRTVAHEWGKYGIVVNALAPAAWTPMYEYNRAVMSPEQIKAHDAMMSALIPLGGQLGNADRDIAPVMIFLASEDSRFITGQIIPVDGGLVSTR